MTLTDECFRQLNDIEQKCFHGSWTADTLLSELNNPLSVLCTISRDDRIIGFALGRAAADEGELFQIAVLEEHRRQGIARQLLSQLHEKLRERGAVCCFLEVRSRNQGAVSLYEKDGYQRIAVRRGYYGDDDALIYRREL